MSDDVIKKYLRLVLGVDGAPTVGPSDLDVKTSILASLAALSVALEKVLPDDAQREQISSLVAQIRETWVKSDALNPVLAERIILTLQGQDGLIDDVPAAELATAENLITYGILHETGTTGDSFEAFLDDVIQFLND
ncbi:hypothetical protein [Kineosporia sp. NBRC 101731]|uniref:hypothetical protein n=1 Tax=Kineosporia sp. NBRC 101731 TaxID=3032199 RepID=UPI0024A5A841|nr:hypothetical protein [Kineosporia sp. NBRC 101731]GLY32530.1 hypothetical protein Kisp02_58950 [Kineosporia sp. NBRC 101731]